MCTAALAPLGVVVALVAFRTPIYRYMLRRCPRCSFVLRSALCRPTERLHSTMALETDWSDHSGEEEEAPPPAPRPKALGQKLD